ncbi:hypothetical protein [Mucilaginibacter flavus]|uniref:hypothetical protein n=1 Tax=Mucilaginibacter flavus TaxID=931504 RepID=UPI0025B5A170|nr:hypothetical protein [Mucilaginibacter flavus]MDN3581590.1 hypothetical protein [Mucilaginibacter flavus]
MENENTDDLFDKPLSDDPQENLRMENELLHLKLQAELGVDPQIINPVDPQVENEFLKNIFDFEHNYASSKRVKLFELLGEPDFIPAAELSDDLLDIALEELNSLMQSKSIVIDYSGEYSNRVKYLFITEELFEQEANDFAIPGMMMHFHYEEFHPNHKIDIEDRAQEFLSEWFKQSFSELSWELGRSFVSPDRKTYTKDEIVAQLKNIFSAFPAFKNEEYTIHDIGFELQEGGGLGHAEGMVKYDAVLENNEVIHFEGPFKIYLSLEQDWWSIFHVVFPGFKYP